jgi:hypothetical protein
MPRYFLLIQHDGTLVKDVEGFALPDVGAAQFEALEGLRTILAEAIMGQVEPAAHMIVIMDENGRELASVPMSKRSPRNSGPVGCSSQLCEHGRLRRTCPLSASARIGCSRLPPGWRRSPLPAVAARTRFHVGSRAFDVLIRFAQNRRVILFVQLLAFRNKALRGA